MDTRCDAISGKREQAAWRLAGPRSFHVVRKSSAEQASGRGMCLKTRNNIHVRSFSNEPATVGESGGKLGGTESRRE